MTTPWLDRTLEIPGPLKLLHGETAALRELAWVYLGALAFTGGALVAFREEALALDALRLGVLVIVTLDLAGGAIANLCPGTRAYWQARPPGLRLAFLAVHGLHALAIAFVFPASAGAAFLAWTWMMIAGACLTLSPRALRGEAPAMALALMGATAVHLSPGLAPFAGVLLTVFLVKLVFSFGAVSALGAAAGD
ncbi:MAG: hypothetical protein ACKN9P_00325 [Phenylobacterium sp.]